MNKTSLAEAETLLFVGTYSGEQGYSSSESKHAALLPTWRGRTQPSPAMPEPA